jgi:hypothetical protein
MQNLLSIKKLSIFVVVFTLVVVSSAFYKPTELKAYSYSGIHWSSYPVSVDTGDASVPLSWITPLAQSMATWNSQTSPFYFNVGYSGHQIKVQNSGNNGAPATAYISYDGSNHITDVDVYFNSYYSWSTSGEAGKYDVKNVATHEFGHWLMLNDLYGGGDTEKTMYGYVSTGETKKRTLETDDINGINAIYP